MYLAQNGELCRILLKTTIDLLVPSASKKLFGICTTLCNSSVNVKATVYIRAGFLTALKMKIEFLSCFIYVLVI
jgi:hypothetical protein